MKNISVIIPAHNEENFIEKSINSFTNQTYKPCEIIVIDDGSTDKTRSICEKISKKNKLLKLFFISKNSGPSAARNLGASNASSEIIFFAEADGEYSKNYLKHCIYPFKYSNNLITGGGLRIPYNKQTVWGNYWMCIFEARWHLLYHHKKQPIGGWMFHIENFNKSGKYNEKYRHGEDIELIDRMKKINIKNVWIPKIYLYHNEPDSWKSSWLKFYSSSKSGIDLRLSRDGLAMLIFKITLFIPLFIPVFFLILSPFIVFLNEESRIAWDRCRKKSLRDQANLSQVLIFPLQFLWVKSASVAGIISGIFNKI